MLVGVQLPSPMFEGGAILGYEGGDTPLTSFQPVHHEASAQGRYFSQLQSTETAEPDERWSRLYESRLEADPGNEELWLAYALDAYHRSSTTKG